MENKPASEKQKIVLRAIATKRKYVYQSFITKFGVDPDHITMQEASDIISGKKRVLG